MTPPKPPQGETPTGKVGAVIFGLAIVFCSMEMVPGWGLLHLGWPPLAFYAIMAVVGILAGGLLAGPGSLIPIALYLESARVAHTALLALLGVLGALPGFGAYFALKAAQDVIYPPGEMRSARSGKRRRREWDRDDRDDRPRRRP